MQEHVEIDAFRRHFWEIPVAPPEQRRETPRAARRDDIASHPNPEAQCGTGGGSGAFGYFGKGSSLAGGADGHQTGLNNSDVCGNRQGNLS